MQPLDGAAEKPEDNKKPLTATTALMVAVAMFAFGYAMEPLYYRLCAALGIDTADPSVLEETRRSAAAPRPMRMEFDANSHNEIVAMVPGHRTTSLDTGAAYRIDYVITNLTDRPVKGLAVPSLSPAHADKWVRKLRCFCFDEVELAPKESRTEPVVLVVDRALPQEIRAVALSYTFYPQDQAPGHGH